MRMDAPLSCGHHKVPISGVSSDTLLADERAARSALWYLSDMRTHAVHIGDLRVAWACEDVADTALRRLLGPFVPAPADAPSLSLRVRPRSAAPDVRGFRQTFKHGVRG